MQLGLRGRQPHRAQLRLCPLAERMAGLPPPQVGRLEVRGDDRQDARRGPHQPPRLRGHVSATLTESDDVACAQMVHGACDQEKKQDEGNSKTFLAG